MPTHFPNGVNNVFEHYATGEMGFPDPTRVIMWFDDFHSYTAAQWTVTETQAGATQAVAAGADGGHLVLVNTATDNDVNQVQWAQESFRLQATKKTWLRARFKVSDATNSDVLVGLYITDTSPVASAPTDGFYFLKADDSTALTFRVGKDSTYTTSGTVATMANDTFVTVTAYLDPVSRTVKLYNDDTRVGSVALTNLPDDEDLAVTIAVQAGDANARTLTIDYLMVVKER